MKEFWSAVQSSGLASVLGGLVVWIFCQVVYAFITAKTNHKYNKDLEEEKALIQHDCDIRLERYRLEFNQLLSEHQTRFKYWHDEKAKAIKELYVDACELYNSLYYLQLFKKLYGKLSLEEKRKRGLDERINKILIQRVEVEKKWYKLRLFLNNEEDNAFSDFKDKVKDWHNVLAERDDQKNVKEIYEKGEECISDMKEVMENLRLIFRMALCDFSSDTSLNNNISGKPSVQQTPINDSSRSES